MAVSAVFLIFQAEALSILTVAKGDWWRGFIAPEVQQRKSNYSAGKSCLLIYFPIILTKGFFTVLQVSQMEHVRNHRAREANNSNYLYRPR